MARKNSKSDKASSASLSALPSQTKRAIITVAFVIVGLLLTLAPFGGAGPTGATYTPCYDRWSVSDTFSYLCFFFVLAGTTLRERETTFDVLKGIASAIFLLAGLGFVAIVSNDGGLIGAHIAAPLVKLFDIYASLIVLGGPLAHIAPRAS